jgi:RNA polymerase sigma factor (sigma-70 family)
MESASPDRSWPPVTADGGFATTRWTVVFDAAREGDSESEAALEALCKSYWSPVYAFVRRSGRSPEDAKDLTQGFFLLLLEKKGFASANPDLGKFRTYLLGALKFFLADEWKKQSALKRGGQAVHFSIDVDGAERLIAEALTDDVTPEILFDRQWIRSVLDAVTLALSAEYGRRNKADLFTELKPFLIGGRQQRGYAEIAEANDISESAVKMAVKRMRARYGELLRQRIAETVGSDEAVDEEIRSLLGIFS